MECTERPAFFTHDAVGTCAPPNASTLAALHATGSCDTGTWNDICMLDCETGYMQTDESVSAYVCTKVALCHVRRACIGREKERETRFFVGRATPRRL